MRETFPPDNPAALIESWTPKSYPVSTEVLRSAFEVAQTADSIADVMAYVSTAAETDPTALNLMPRLGQAGIVSTGLTRNPGPKGHFKAEWLAGAQIKNMADTMLALTRGLKGYKNLSEPEHIRRILGILCATQDGFYDDVHLEDVVIKRRLVVKRDPETRKAVIKRERKIDGTVVYGSIQFVMETEEEATELQSIFAPWLMAQELADDKHARHVSQPHLYDAQGHQLPRRIVQIEGTTENDWHVLELSAENLLARWLKLTTDTVLSAASKGTLEEVLEDDHETINPYALAYFRRVVNDYQRMTTNLESKITYWDGGDYYQDPKLHLYVDRKPFITVPAAPFAINRKVRNGIARQLDRDHNAFQHRNIRRRLRLEVYCGTEIRRSRAKPSTPDSKPRAPGGARPASFAELNIAKLSGDKRDVAFGVADVVVGIANVLGSLTVVGLALTSAAAVKKIPRAVRAVKSTARRRQAWKDQAKAARLDVRTRVAGQIGSMLAEQTSQVA